jgi:hypothetical protein
VRVDHRPRDFTNTTPLRVLRSFLPPAQGGIDKNHCQQLAEQALIPLHFLPKGALVPPYRDTELVRRFRIAFVKLFVQFPLPEARNLSLQDKQQPTGIGQDPNKTLQDMSTRVIQAFLDPRTQNLGDQPEVHYSQNPRSPRDNLLRGRLDDATSKLVEALEQVRYQKDLAQSEPELPRKITQWFEDVVAAQANLQRAQRQNPPVERDLEEANQKMLALWSGGVNPLQEEADARNGGKTARRTLGRLPVWLVFILERTALPLDADATYLLALCKHEKAEKAQAKFERLGSKKGTREEKEAQAAWKTADSLWSTYLENHPADPASAAARLWRARALEALGEREAAIGLLQNLSGSAGPLEEMGRLYRSRQLAKR